MKNGVLLIIKRALLAAAVVCVFALLLSASAANYNGICGENVTWSLDTETGILTISGTGAMINYDGSSSKIPWYNKRSYIKSVNIENGVTSIYSYAFSDCTSLTSVTIGKGVTSIGGYAFSGCAGLTSVTIPAGVTSIGYYAFSGCTGVISVTIDDGVMTSIGNYAFYGCSSLISITIPAGVTRIGQYAFYNCASLMSVSIPDSVTSIGRSAFDNTGYYNDSSNRENGVLFIGKHLIQVETSVSGAYTIKSGTKTIAANAFSGCTELTSVTIPDSVMSISDFAFSNCTSLKSIAIPDSVTSIGDSAFYKCTSLSGINIPDSVTSIGQYAFYYCYGLTSVTIPAGVESIGGYTFYNCYGITSVSIPDSVTSIGQYAFDYCNRLETVYYAGTETQWGQIRISDNNSKLTNATGYYADDPSIDSGDCGDGVFWNLDGVGTITISGSGVMDDYTSSSKAPWAKHSVFIKKAVIASGVLSVGNYAFDGCGYLSEVSLPDGLRFISYCAFSGCVRLCSIIIPDSVRNITSNAFSGCSGLTQIYVGNGNIYYSFIDGVLFNKDETVIICCVGGKTGDYSVPVSVMKIESFAFSGCSGLTSVTIPDSVTSIGSSAFRGCTGLTKITLPFVGASRDATSTNDQNKFFYIFGGFWGSAYSVPSSLKEVVITDVTSIGRLAFDNCEGLTSVTIPDGVTSIGVGAFYSCTSLTSITIPDSVTYIGNLAFFSCTSLTSITIPDSVTSIGSEAFRGCTGLTSVTICNAAFIKESAFAGCVNIVKIKLLFGVNDIAASAFSGCKRLTEIYIPKTLTSIGDNAFKDCVLLDDVYYEGSEEDFGKLTVGSGNENLYYAFLHCGAEPPVDYPVFEAKTAEISAKYADVYVVSAEQTRDKVTVHVTNIGDAAAEENITVFCVSYDENGKLTAGRAAVIRKTANGADFTAKTSGSVCKIFVLDGACEPIIKALLSK